ncbi:MULTISPECIES: tyrosine-type recombinase/integrase [unclassified Nonomuraea]|uniref:tyrosine-type recombinase/integrase n=1 Tax=unclassified Nonomuraea TaxID=2593643 RepID=UPI003405428D
MPGRDRGHAAQSCSYSARRSIASAIRTGTFRRGSPCGTPHGKEATPRPQDHGLVFASLVGTPLDAHNVRRAFRKIVKDAGMPAYYWTPREMRHSFVSLLTDSGVPLEDLAWSGRQDLNLRPLDPQAHHEGARSRPIPAPT